MKFNWIRIPVIALALLAGPIGVAAQTKKPFAPSLPPFNFDPLGIFTAPTSTTPSPAATSLTNAVGALQSFTVADLQNAIGDAQAQTPPDTVAITCYNALLPAVEANVKNPLPAKAGVFMALQKARDLADNGSVVLSSIQNGPINTACAPLVLSTSQTLLGLQAKGIAAAGAISLIIPKIP
jgi:hypothetical protein